MGHAGVGYREPRRIATEDGLPQVFAVNTLAPYILTALIQKPGRLVYLSSMLHQNGDASLQDLGWEGRPWQGQQAYPTPSCTTCSWHSAVARHRPGVFSATRLSLAGCRPKWAALGGSGRYGRGTSNPGVACGQRRQGRQRDGAVFFPYAAAQTESDHLRCGDTGSPHRGLRSSLGSGASR